MHVVLLLSHTLLAYQTLEYTCTSNMHSPVTVLNSVPSAHVCRNAFKEAKHEKSDYKMFN